MPSAGAYLAQSISSLRLRLPDFQRWRIPTLRRRPQQPSPAALARMIESEIIPRLMIAHRPAAVQRPHDATQISEIRREEVLAFAPMSIERDAAALLEFAEGLVERGVAIESILLDLIVPAARELGSRWEEDTTDFLDVTMGLWRMQELSYELTSRLPVSFAMTRHRALFSPMPGDQHSFGSLMVAEFFRLSGWHSQGMIEPERAALLAELAAGDYDLYGLNVTRDQDLDDLEALISDVRHASRNKKLIVLVGGRAIPGDAGYVEARGADATAGDARDAVAVAARLIVERVEAVTAN
jgi:MerR family transcriptional regulator, light-induced transcriptional regulator